MTAAFLNTGILSGIRKRTDSSFQTALVLSGQDKYLSALLFFFKGVACIPPIYRNQFLPSVLLLLLYLLP